MKYKCDRCFKVHDLDENLVKNKQYYVPPRGCHEGDYYINVYFWFKCDCSRAIKVKEHDLKYPYKIEKDYTEYSGVCINN